jgi:hypothetical protein
MTAVSSRAGPRSRCPGSGGAIQLPGAYYRPVVGLVLLLGAARLLAAVFILCNSVAGLLGNVAS